jgi:hypothetical protein
MHLNWLISFLRLLQKRTPLIVFAIPLARHICHQPFRSTSHSIFKDNVAHTHTTDRIFAYALSPCLRQNFGPSRHKTLPLGNLFLAKELLQ